MIRFNKKASSHLSIGFGTLLLFSVLAFIAIWFSLPGVASEIVTALKALVSAFNPS